MTRLALVLLLLACLAGCIPVPAKSREEPLVLSIAADPSDQTTLTTASNAHSVDVKVEAIWRSGGSHFHRLVAPARGKYLILAYERGHGFAPVKIRSVSQNRPKIDLHDGSGYALGWMLLTAPIWVPIDLSFRPTELPKDGFVWLEDAETGEVVAGMYPWNIERAFAQPVDDAGPRDEKDYWVSCIVGGTRKWAYGSRCDP